MAKTVVQRMPSRRRRRLTEEEFLHLPDDGRKYELVDGEVKEAPAGVKHDVIALRLGAKLLACAGEKAYVAGSQAGFRMVSGNLRSPDVSVILKESLPGGQLPEGFGERAPDLAIEVVSPTEDLPDLLRKVAEYFASGARQVWLLFPEKQEVMVYRSPFDMQVFHAEDELTGGEILPEFQAKVSELVMVE